MHRAAIEGYSAAIRQQPTYSTAYANRGMAYEALGNIQNACKDWQKASELGDAQAKQWVATQCTN
jgi:tetratricopeptide (TPR) repeat protein